MKRHVLTLCTAISVFSTSPSSGALAGTWDWFGKEQTYNVKTYSRLWRVEKVADEPALWRAERDMNQLNPYGISPVPRTVQATSAIEMFTGCKVIRSSMYETISGHFFSQVACN